MIDIKFLKKSYNNIFLFDTENIKITKEGLYIIRGENGCGKSTLLRIIFGKDKDFEGDIKVSYKKKILLPQNPYIFRTSVISNILMGIKEKDIIDYAYKLLEEFRLNKDKKALDLSMGQKQILSFIRAVIRDSDLLLLDEPDTYLDVNIKEKVYQIILEQSKIKPVIMVTHNNDLFEKENVNYLIFEDKRIIYRGG
ncbi:ATP-binding cassette domain-containing protein [Caldicellulosiruptoraceae bacterium PP1]